VVSSTIRIILVLCVKKEVTETNFERITRWLAIAVGAGYIGLVLALGIMRLAYPYEVEWMEGAMMDHAMRIIEGKAIYTAPTIDFVAWLYPPLYYYAVAAMIKIAGVGFFAGRFVSFLSTIVTVALLGLTVKRITKNSLFSFFAVALYFATYHATGFYFDIVRNDAFFTMLIVLTASVAMWYRGRTGVIITAVLLAICFLTRQQAIFFLPPLAFWFWWRDHTDGWLFSVVAIVLSLLLIFYINHATNGWLTYYMFRIPSAKRADFSWVRMIDVLPGYVFGAFTTFSLSAMALIALHAGDKKAFWNSETGLLILMAIAALVAGAFSIGNEGGFANVIMPFAAFVVPLLPIALAELPQTQVKFAPLAYTLLLIQFLALYFNPLSEKMVIASAHQRSGGDRFMRHLAAIPGEVFIPYHGFITRQAGKPSHAHVLSSLDVLRVHDSTARRLQADYDSAYVQHRFSAIILEESEAFGRDSVQHYRSDGVMLDEPNVYLTRVADKATRPQFIFVPKQ
jgi:hypothetical protein